MKDSKSISTFQVRGKTTCKYFSSRYPWRIDVGDNGRRTWDNFAAAERDTGYFRKTTFSNFCLSIRIFCKCFLTPSDVKKNKRRSLSLKNTSSQFLKKENNIWNSIKEDNKRTRNNSFFDNLHLGIKLRNKFHLSILSKIILSVVILAVEKRRISQLITNANSSWWWVLEDVYPSLTVVNRS